MPEVGISFPSICIGCGSTSESKFERYSQEFEWLISMGPVWQQGFENIRKTTTGKIEMAVNLCSDCKTIVHESATHEKERSLKLSVLLLVISSALLSLFLTTELIPLKLAIFVPFAIAFHMLSVQLTNILEIQNHCKHPYRHYMIVDEPPLSLSLFKRQPLQGFRFGFTNIVYFLTFERLNRNSGVESYHLQYTPSFKKMENNLYLLFIVIDVILFLTGILLLEY